MTDLLIIGAGPAGLTAALYALRAGLSVNVFEKNMYGGQVSIIDKIENYPGMKNVLGADFSNNLYEQVKNLGAEFVFDEVKKVDLKGLKKIINTHNGVFESKTVIIANGLKRRELGCTGEQKFKNRGVSYCATCDSSFFKNKSVVVVGGGNTALEDSLYLSKICKNIILAVRGSFFKAEQALIEATQTKDNIEIKMETTVQEIKGENKVESVTLKSKNGKIKEFLVSGVFVAIGYEPDNQIYKNQIDIDENGYFLSSETCSTNIPGIFVAGDCRVKPLRQIVTATADGAVAGNMAAKFIATYEIKERSKN